MLGVEESNFNKRLGNFIRRLREQRGMSQRQLGVAVGVIHQQMQKYEVGECGIGSYRLCLIANVLEVSISDLVDRGAYGREYPKLQEDDLIKLMSDGEIVESAVVFFGEMVDRVIKRK
ncbi:MAG: helix-turn-helix domain-containing protein [Rickettsiales bacterium]|nr:helix-turn-helix domain-containing protein [Rickettsiales bacterium]